MESMRFVKHWRANRLWNKWSSGKWDWCIFLETLVLPCFSDDEGSEEEDNGEGGEGGEDDEEYAEEEEEEGEGDGYEDEDDDDDDAYEDEEDEEEEEDAESPSFFFGNNPIQQQAWNNFKFAAPKTPSSQPETTTDLSSMIATFNVCSPFSFGQPTTTQATDSKWTTLTHLEKVKEHLQVS